MLTRTKALTTALALAVTLLVSAPAANAAEYWASSSSPSNVKNNQGTTLGQAYGRGWNSTVNVNSSATYKRVTGEYGIYVNSNFLFYSYNANTKQTQWNSVSSQRHQATSGTSWYNTSKSTTLRSNASQSRVSAQACTDVPFLVPGNCTGNHILTNSY